MRADETWGDCSELTEESAEEAEDSRLPPLEVALCRALEAEEAAEDALEDELEPPQPAATKIDASAAARTGAERVRMEESFCS